MGVSTALLGLLFVLGFVQGRSQSSFGYYFRMAFMDNFVDYPIDRPVDVYVCNKETSRAIVTVAIPYLNHANCAAKLNKPVDAGRCRRFVLCNEIRHTYADASVAPKVVEIKSDRLVSVHGLNVEKFSADSYAILPWNATGRAHRVMSHTLQQIQTQFIIVAKESTKVRIVIPDRDGETITVDYNGLRYTNGQSLVFRLDRRDSFLAQSAGDLTGVLVQSEKNVAVFTGNVRTYNDYIRRSRDHLVEQVPPMLYWGMEFMYVPTPRTNLGDSIKIISSSENTDITFTSLGGSGTAKVTIGRGPYIRNLTAVTLIKARRNVLIAVISKSQEGKAAASTDPADPSMYFLPAITQYESDYFLPDFKDAEGKPYDRVYVLLAMKGSSGGVRIDGRSLSNFAGSMTSYQGYRVGTYAVAKGQDHRIRHRNGARMMVIGYGASDRESFASTLGYRFDGVGCTESDMVLNDRRDNDCDGQEDEEVCGDRKDNDNDGLLDEDCSSEKNSVKGSGDATGTSFALSFMSNVVQDAPVHINQIELYITVLEPGTFVSVTAPAYTGSFGPTLTDIQGSLDSVMQVPFNPIMRVNNAIGISTRSNKGIKVTSNKNIVVYGINKKQFSTDGFLALPDSVTGSEYFAYCNFPINTRDDRCEFNVVPIADNTDLRMVLMAGVELELLNGQRHIGPKTVQIVLNAYEALEIQSKNDLTGTRVYSPNGKKFSFFSGNIRSRIPIGAASRDHLVEQLPPASTWGKHFSSMSTPREKPIGDVFKVIARMPNTVVDYHYNQIGQTKRKQKTLAESGSHMDIDLGFPSPMSINSNNPVLVIQVSKSATNRDTDPSAMVLIPEDNWSNNYRFVTPLSGQRDSNNLQLPFKKNSVIIAIDKNYRNGLKLTVPGAGVINIGTLSNWQAIPNTNNEGLMYVLPPGYQGQNLIHHDNQDARWMALIFGTADRETYGNAIGLRLDGQANGCRKTLTVAGDKIDNDCDGAIDEEQLNGVDDDGDNKIDEDLGVAPTQYRYIFVFEENVVEFPRHYALEIYVGSSRDGKVVCRMETPSIPQVASRPFYDVAAVVNDGYDNKIQFAVSASLRSKGTSLELNAIVMTCNRRSTVMGINKEVFSSDAFIAFEQSALGKEYYTVSFGPPTLKTQFAVIAVESGTTDVKFKLRAAIEWQTVQYADNFEISLKRYQVFQAQSEKDLTGTRITSDKPIAVFSGNIRTRVYISASRDHLVSQLPPTRSWGNKFVLVPAKFRTVGDLFRVVARTDNTMVSISGRGSVSLNRGRFHEFESKSARILTANNPVMVMQMLKSQVGPFATETADPCFILVPSTSQFVTSVTLVTPLYSRGFYRDGEHYINHLSIVFPVNNGGSGYAIRKEFRINDEKVTSSAVVMGSLRSVTGANNFKILDLKLNGKGVKTYTITHSNSNLKFAGHLVGIADRESYCVPIGPRLS